MLDRAIKLARTYEQCLASPPLAPTWTASRSFTKPATSTPVTPQQSTASASSIRNKTSSILKLTAAKVAERYRKNQCFHCNDQYIHNHKEQCRQLFMIKVIADEPPEQPSKADLTVSLHALTGIQPRSGHTM
jgi:hypothetical protein